MATYSFQNVSATLVGTGGVVDLGYGSGNDKEGISITFNATRNTMTIGADGEVMHSLKSDKSGVVAVRLMRTSDKNAQLQLMANAQFLSPALHGTNVITIRDKGNNEVCVCRDVAFQNVANRTFAEDGSVQEWLFDCGKIDFVTGTY